MRLLETGERECALVVLVAFECYLRPGEAHRLRCCDVVAPVGRAGRAHRYGSLVLHPAEALISSKTREFDETVLLDLSRQRPLLRALLQHARNRPPSERLFTVSQSYVATAFARAGRELKLSSLGAPHMYQLRHGGGSHDFSSQVRDLAAVQLRGRWRSAQSVRRYQKGGRLTQQLRKLPPPLQRHAVRCGERVYKALSDALSVCPAP